MTDNRRAAQVGRRTRSWAKEILAYHGINGIMSLDVPILLNDVPSGRMTGANLKVRLESWVVGNLEVVWRCHEDSPTRKSLQIAS